MRRKTKRKEALFRDLLLKNFGTEEKENAGIKQGVPTMRKGFLSKNSVKQ